MKRSVPFPARRLGVRSLEEITHLAHLAAYGSILYSEAISGEECDIRFNDIHQAYSRSSPIKTRLELDLCSPHYDAEALLLNIPAISIHYLRYLASQSGTIWGRTTR